MASLGFQMIAALAEKDYHEFARTRLDPEWFNPAEWEVVAFVHDHVQKYQAMPSKDLITKSVGDVAAGMLPDSASEAAMYYLDRVKDRFRTTELNAAMIDARTYLKSEDLDPGKALDIVAKAVMDLSTLNGGGTFFSIEDVEALVTAEYLKIKDPKTAPMFMGWPTLDDLMSGIYETDFITIVGRPGMGKTYSLMQIAYSVWWRQSRRVLLVSMEMPVIALAQRLTAIKTGICIDHIKKAHLVKSEFSELTKGLAEMAGAAPLWMVDSNVVGNVDEIYVLARQLKPDLILIDGAYLLGHANPRMNKYERVGENAEAMKRRICNELQTPVVCTYQFNREAEKKSKKGKPGVTKSLPGLEDIGMSDAIGQLSSLVLGIIDEQKIETFIARRVSILKDREGGVGAFWMRWNFRDMDFTEIDPEAEAKAEINYIG